MEKDGIEAGKIKIDNSASIKLIMLSGGNSMVENLDALVKEGLDEDGLKDIRRDLKAMLGEESPKYDKDKIEKAINFINIVIKNLDGVS